MKEKRDGWKEEGKDQTWPYLVYVILEGLHLCVQ